MEKELVEKKIQQAFSNLAEKVWNEFQIKVVSVNFEWIEPLTADKSDLLLYRTRSEIESFPQST